MNAPASKLLTVDPRLLSRGWNSRRRQIKDFDACELFQSIGQLGIVQKPTIRIGPLKQGFSDYELVSGNRRIDCALEWVRRGRNDFARIECVLEPACDAARASLLNFAENSGREELQAWEKSESLCEMIAIYCESTGCDELFATAYIALQVGMSARHVAALVKIKRRLHPALWNQLVTWGDSAKIGWLPLSEIAGLPKEEQIKAWKSKLDADSRVTRRGKERKPGPAKLRKYRAEVGAKKVPKRTAEWHRGAEYAFDVALGARRWGD